MRRLLVAVVAMLAAAGLALPAGAAKHATRTDAAPYRAFTDASYWNTPVPTGADARNGAYLKWLKANASKGITLGMGDWAMPVYWSSESDPLVTIDPKNGPTVTFREPDVTTTMAGNDAAIVFFDPTTDQSVQLFEFDPATNTATGSARYFLDSEGLAESIGGTAGNDGHRGVPGAVHMVREDEIAAGLIAHRLKVALPGTGDCGVYPMAGWEHGKGGIICEGMVLHIKRSVDLKARGFTGAALTIATALQQYGGLVGDNGGGPKVSLKMQAGVDWSAYGLRSGSVWKGLSWSDFVFAPGGWHE